MLVFEEREKPENQSKDENQQQTQPTYGVKYEIGKKRLNVQKVLNISFLKFF